MGNENDETEKNLNKDLNLSHQNNSHSNNKSKSYHKTKTNNNKNKKPNLESSYNGFCGNISNQDIIYNKKKTEIDLTTTYSSAKGTYTKESYRLFSEKEKDFFYLVQRNNISGIRYLIIQGVNINILDEERTSPLHIACKESSIQTIEEIIFQGSMINIPDLVGWTPLHMACYYNRPDVVLLLLKSGANYNTHNRDKYSARDLAIKFKNFNCVKVLDNFIKYQKIEKEKCLKEINNNNYDYNNSLNDDIYEEILKKYIIYQKLKREYMQNNETILSNNELNLSKNENEENEKSDGDMVNDEFYPTIQAQKNGNENLDLYQIEKCLNLLSAQITQRKDLKNKKDENDAEITPQKQEFNKRNNLLLSKYKFIPKKHKFYLKYKYKDGKFIIKTKNKIYNHKLQNDIYNYKNNNENDINRLNYFQLINNEINEDEDENKKKLSTKKINLIQLPTSTSIPKMTAFRNLNNININTYSKTKSFKSIKSFHDKRINEEEDKTKIELESEIYKPYNYGDEEEYKQNKDNTSDEEEINFEIPLNVLYKNNSTFNKTNEEIEDNEYDDEKTISLDDENINFHCSNFLTNNYNYKDQKILLNPFHINKNPDKNIVQFFLAHNDIYEEVLQIIFHFDYFFGLQFLMTISDIDNSIISLINYVSNNIYNSRLRLEILNLMNYKNKSTILESYFTLLNSKNNSIFQSIKKILKLFDLTTNDIKLIDQLSNSFAKIYYNYSPNNNKLFQSQNAVYFFVFSFIITQVTYNQNIYEQIDKEKIICDMIIMLKGLNEGKNYNNNLIEEAVYEIIKNNEPIVVPYIINNYEKKVFNLQIRRSKDNLLVSNYGYFQNGILYILNSKREILQIINFQLDKNISCTLIPHSYKICFTSLQNKIIEINNTGNTIEFKKLLFFEVYIHNSQIMNNINIYFQEKRSTKKK